MKKIVLALAVVFSVALVSCGNKQAAAENDTPNVEAGAVEVVEGVANDSDSNKVEVTEVAEGAVVEEAPAAEAPAAENK